jgi:hypothetical protein
MAFAVLAGPRQIADIRIRKALPLVSLKTRIQVMLTSLSDSSSLKGMLFSDMQATMQAPQPVHLSRSMAIPYFMGGLCFCSCFIRTSCQIG